MPITARPRELPFHKVAEIRTKVVVALILVAALMGPIALVVAATSKPASAPPAANAMGAEEPMAAIAASDFLAGRATTLPLASGVDPYFGRQTPATGAGTASTAAVPIPHSSIVWSQTTDGDIGGQSYELDTFLVISGTTRYDLCVQVVDVPGVGPVIGADPTLTLSNMEVVAAGSGPAGLDYSALQGKKPESVPASATSSADRWATDYVQNDQSDLYNLTGDTADHTYYGLSGWTLVSVTIPQSIATGNLAVLEVEVTMQSTDLGTKQPVTVTCDYDILENNVTTQEKPNVVAWGPAGSGPTLYPYMNANQGVEPSTSGS